MSEKKNSRKLTPKEQRFIREYLIDLNATQAAIRAGYSANSAREIAHKKLTKVHIKEPLHRAMAEQSRRTGITADRVLREIAKIAFAEMKNFAEWGPSGISLRHSSEISDEDSACIQELSESVSEGGGSTKFKLYDKKSALELLMKHLGCFSKDNEININISEIERIRDLTDEELVKELEQDLASCKKKEGQP